MDNLDTNKIANALLELIARGKRMYAPSLANLTKKELLAYALRGLLEHQKATLELMHGVNALAKATVEEKKEAAAAQPRKLESFEPPRCLLNETMMRADAGGVVDLWYIWSPDTRSDGPIYYPTKLVAEMAARARYPDEDEDRRYGRIYYRSFKQQPI